LQLNLFKNFDRLCNRCHPLSGGSHARCSHVQGSGSYGLVSFPTIILLPRCCLFPSISRVLNPLAWYKTWARYYGSRARQDSQPRFYIADTNHVQTPVQYCSHSVCVLSSSKSARPQRPPFPKSSVPLAAVYASFSFPFFPHAGLVQRRLFLEKASTWGLSMLT
jgi:hypothetical protein